MSEEKKEETWGPFRIVNHGSVSTDGLLVLIANANESLGKTVFNEDGSFEIKLEPGAEKRIVVINFGDDNA